MRKRTVRKKFRESHQDFHGLDIESDVDFIEEGLLVRNADGVCGLGFQTINEVRWWICTLVGGKSSISCGSTPNAIPMITFSETGISFFAQDPTDPVEFTNTYPTASQTNPNLTSVNVSQTPTLNGWGFVSQAEMVAHRNELVKLRDDLVAMKELQTGIVGELKTKGLFL